MTGRAAGLLGLAAALTANQPTMAATLCDQLVAPIRKLSDTGGVVGFDNLRPVARPGREVAADVGEAKARERLKGQFGITDSLTSEIDDIAGPTVARIIRLGDSDAYVAMASLGTPHCESYVFFVRHSGDEARKAPGPFPADVTCPRGGFAGSVAGKPVFAIADTNEETGLSRFRLAEWRGDHWDGQCTVTARWALTYDLDDVWYPDPRRISEFEALAVRLGPELAHGGKPAFPQTYDHTLFERMRGLAAGPAFDERPGPDWPKEQTGQRFAGAPIDLPFVSGGNTYLVRAGRLDDAAGRATPDSIMALYDLRDDRMVALGSVRVSVTLGRLTDIEVQPGITPAAARGALPRP
ncbi:MAG TPA: hypothetical protein VFN88_09625 [Caulobacteraceae bacterium]|nr:hypothetical protein [Caulobacteraceae bacterium]